MYANHRIGLGALTLALAMLLGGCGDKQEAGQTADQLAARVNGEAITVPELEHELAKLNNLAPEQRQAAANQLLKSLVDQRILVRRAIEEKLDADAEVSLSLESARRQILAQAYLQKSTAATAKPDDAAIGDYFAKHPELFAERRIYRLQEINVQAGPERLEAVKAQLAQSKNLNDFVAWLKAESIPARVGQSTKAAEQLPLEILPRLHQLKDGQAMTMASAGSLTILFVAGSQTQPMTQEQARPVIERFLQNARKREAAEAELKKLKEQAKIEYLGAYADAGKEPAKPAEASAAPAPAGAGGNDPQAAK